MRTLLRQSLVLLALTPAVHAATVASVFNGRVPCVPVSGVGQLCSSVGVLDRVETWDGVPLDVTLTLPPPEQDGPFPLIIDLHGFGAGKTPNPELEALVPQGYALLIYSARGIHFSCGFAAARLPDPTISDPEACEDRGWIRLADARYDVRDAQYLAGVLVDEGLVIPDKIGVTGVSYGGGQTLIHAALRNRTMLPGGSLVPWQSPLGVDLEVAAAAPIIGWSDLAYALAPNGRTLDYRDLNPYVTLGVSERAGVMKKSYVDALFNVGVATGFYSAPGLDLDADIQVWKEHLDAGEPYDSNPVLRDALDEIMSHHSSYYLDDSVLPPPLLIYNAFTDDIMPVDEALRFYRKTKSVHPSADISLLFADGFAHPRGLLASPMRAQLYERVVQHFDWHLKGIGAPVPGVETFTQACNGSAQAGPFTAADWDAIHPGEVRHADATPKVFTSAAGDALNAFLTDPVAGGALACRTAPPSADDPAAATYRLPAAACSYTLMGSPTVIADLTVSGSFAEVASRLWDVAPDGTQSLVTHGLYRPRTDNLGPQVFQLHPNGWQFAVGHVAKLELLGQSHPYGRASNGTFTITASNLELRLPVLETPGPCVEAPAPAVFPPTTPEPLDTTTTTTQPGGTTTTTIFPGAAQLVLGKSFQVTNPGSPAQRRVSGRANERASDNAIVGNPATDGAVLEVIANGSKPSAQTFALPSQGWTARGGANFRYSNRATGGAVKRASIKRTRNGTFQIKVLIQDRDGSVTVTPPDPATNGGFILNLPGGDRYCVAFGGAAGGRVVRNDAQQWSARNATAEGCPVAQP